MGINQNSKSLEELNKLAKQCQRFSNLQGEVVKNSEFVVIENKIDENKLSETEEDAMHEARYIANRKKEPVDENNEISEDEMVDRYLRDLFNGIFE